MTNDDWLMKFRGMPAEAGMAMVLLGLAVFFSVATWSEQPASGAAAARPVVDRIVARFGKEARVMVVSGGLPEEGAFAAAVEAGLKERGATVVAMVTGEPRDARVALEELAAKGGKLDGIAASALASGWLVFDAVKSDFPGLGDPVLIAPERQRGSNFLKRENLLNIANQIAVIAIMAIGMTLVILTGGIDLSVGSLLALAAVTAALLIREAAGAELAGPAGMILACLGSIALCGVVGGITGWFVTRARIAPFIVTLAVMLIGSGTAYRITSGESVHQIPESFIWLGRGADLFGIPNAVVLMLVLYAAAHLMMTRMVVGRHLYAVGGNRTAAKLSGIPVDRVVVFAYVMSALLAGLGGVVMASQLKSGSPTYGEMYELYVIAAVVVGGTSLSGGRGSMIGTLLGAFVIAVIQNGMNLMGVESFSQKIVLGAIILGAVWMDRARRSEGGAES
jgi:ribose transport system permease protein